MVNGGRQRPVQSPKPWRQMIKAPGMIRVIRGRRGRRGRRGPMPQHQWSEDRGRIRFESEPGKWGAWSASLEANTD